MNTKKSKIRRLSLILGGLFLAFIGAYFTWASYSTDYYYFPDGYENDEAIHLSITASGPNNNLDYYPGGYGVYVKDNSAGKRTLSKFEIKDPAIKSTESYSSDVVCNSLGQPEYCVSMNYVFSWTDPSGRKIESKIEGHKYVGQTGFINIMPDIIKKAFYFGTQNKVFSNGETQIELKKGVDELLLVKTYFYDDKDLEGFSLYKDISKKFVFRTKKEESSYIGISHSDKTLWGSDGKVSAENMKYLNFATVHVKADTSGIITYKTWIAPNQDSIKIITVDMDNIAYDSQSRPELVSYIDMKIMRVRNDGSKFYVNRNGFEQNVPFHRISLQPAEYTTNYKTVPGIDTSVTEHSIGPSGSFICDKGTIGTPGFVECFNDSANFKGITQHTIHIPDYNDYQIVEFTVYNASTYAGNAFAIAGNIDMFGNDVPIDELLADIGGNASVSGITSVEVDNKIGDDENGFDDDTKETKIGYLHTYKTEICNNTDASVSNVLVGLNLPEKGELVGTNSTDSSLFLNSSNLDNPIIEENRLNIDIFNSQINLGTLAPSDCKYLTYQAKVDSTVNQGDILKVKNTFSYDGGAIKETNEVENPVLAMTYDADIELDSEPGPGSDVYLKDYITYKFSIRNTGLTDIGTGSVICNRFSDTIETECMVGDSCGTIYNFTDFAVGTEIAVNYAVQVKDGQNPGTIIEEQCEINYEVDGGNIENKKSNIINHTIVDQSSIIDGGIFSLELYSRPKLLNTPDGEPRPDGLDKSPIKYTYKYTGSNHEYMYPSLSKEGTYTDSRGSCSSITWPNKPNSVTYNIYTTSTSARSTASFSSNNINFSLNTTLPNTEPKTTLSNGTLTPSHYVSGSEANLRYKSGGTKELPLSSTEHRALVNGTDGKIESNITGTTYLDMWKYVPYDNDRCYYSCGSAENPRTCSRSYTLYRWEHINRETVQFNAQAYRYVTVGGSSAWLKTSNGNVHTNDKLTEDGTIANNYDLGEVGYTNVTSAPKLYAPVGASHGDYIVSSNTSTTNLKSQNDWYIYNKDVQKGHGYVYDRLINSRDFYVDLLEKQKFGTVKTITNTVESRLDLELNTIYYYPNNLTLEKAGGNVIVAGRKGTVVVGGDLYINSNIKYSTEAKNSIKDLPFLGLIVKGNVYINGVVTDTVGTRHIDGMLHTGNSTKTLRHLGNWTGTSFDFQRKAPEFYERDVNEPSEWIYFDDRIYVTTPPGFANLDDGIWSYKSNINQFTGEEVEW